MGVLGFRQTDVNTAATSTRAIEGSGNLLNEGKQVTPVDRGLGIIIKHDLALRDGNLLDGLQNRVLAGYAVNHNSPPVPGSSAKIVAEPGEAVVQAAKNYNLRLATLPRRYAFDGEASSTRNTTANPTNTGPAQSGPTHNHVTAVV
jgi:hypothetical protein